LFRQKYSLDIDNKLADGLYFVGLGGSIGNPYRPKVGFYVRWDLYKKLGYPKIETFEDFIPVVKRMLQFEPMNKDGKQNYGVSAWFGQGGEFGVWSLRSPFYFYSGYIASLFYEIDEDTDDIKPTMTDANSMFWKGIEWWNKAYRAGIVDPDAFVQKFASSYHLSPMKYDSMRDSYVYKTNNVEVLIPSDPMGIVIIQEIPKPEFNING